MNLLQGMHQIIIRPLTLLGGERGGTMYLFSDPYQANMS